MKILLMENVIRLKFFSWAERLTASIFPDSDSVRERFRGQRGSQWRFPDLKSSVPFDDSAEK
jgi:hypothetical protein